MNNSKVCTSCQFANPSTSKYCMKCGEHLDVSINVQKTKLSNFNLDNSHDVKGWF